MFSPEQPARGIVRERNVKNPDFKVIRAAGLTKRFTADRSASEVLALKGINLEIASGEIVALVGPSGAGKSTLLHILGLMDTPSAGELEILGRTAQSLEPEELDNIRNEKIGFLFQFYHLLPEFTALENILFPAMIKGQSLEEVRLYGEDLLKALGLGERLHHLPTQLSGGEQQRVALARALLNNPQIILADEPTGNLEQAQGEEIRDLLWRTARSRGATIVLATHNPDLAKKADRIIHLVDGQITNE